MVMNSEMDLLKDPLQHLNRIAQRPTLDIEFQNLKYFVRNFTGGRNQILHSISGQFNCGELTAILGPSGAGKSTLLNILAGYVNSGIEGDIKINSVPRDSRIFKKLSSYILQDNILQPYLTVKESIIYAANFKLGSHVKKEDKIVVAEEIINLLGLKNCIDTRTEFLSGGQKKRLCIALELVNNPPVIFLDEPTTGLDYYATKKCIGLLKEISKLNRTVICTIHQLPASLFRYFDQVYVVADGYCVYNGSPDQMVPFLSLAGCPCPVNNTPTDYILELVQMSSSATDVFQAAIHNGKINMKENSRKIEQEMIKAKDLNFSLSFISQLYLLLSRKLLQMRRNKTVFFIQLFVHLFIGLLLSTLFGRHGNDSSYAEDLVKFCIACNLFFSYIYIIAGALLFPLEVKILRREYFNRWYSLKAYYCTLTLANLPILIILAVVFVFLTYFMTDQPKDIDRITGFLLGCIIIAITSQGLGYMIGSVFNVTIATVAGPIVLGVLFAISIHGIGYQQSNMITPFFKMLLHVDYLRNGFAALSNSLFYKRRPLYCKEIFCYFSRAEVILNHIAITPRHYIYDVAFMVIFLVLFRIMGYLLLKFRLKSEFSAIPYYIKNLIKNKF